MNKFLDRADSKLQLASRRDYEIAMLILREYVNTFGTVLLRAGEVMPTMFTRRKQASNTCDSFEPVILERLIRGFELFFLHYKVNTTPELRRQTVQIIDEFLAWLAERSYLPVDCLLTRLLYSLEEEFAAVTAAKILRNQIAHSNAAPKRWQDIRDGEPLYMVSRTKSGKIWLIYLTENGYDDFGPVAVPLGLTDIVKPGWCIECSLGLNDGRWQMRSSGKVLAV